MKALVVGQEVRAPLTMISRTQHEHSIFWAGHPSSGEVEWRDRWVRGGRRGDREASWGLAKRV